MEYEILSQTVKQYQGSNVGDEIVRGTMAWKRNGDGKKDESGKKSRGMMRRVRWK